jgi:hypothetical protein
MPIHFLHDFKNITLADNIVSIVVKKQKGDVE